jgi:hypothetical protein
MIIWERLMTLSDGDLLLIVTALRSLRQQRAGDNEGNETLRDEIDALLTKIEEHVLESERMRGIRRATEQTTAATQTVAAQQMGARP